MFVKGLQVFRMRNYSQKVYKISVQLQNNKTSGKTLNHEVHYQSQKYCVMVSPAHLKILI